VVSASESAQQPFLGRLVEVLRTGVGLRYLVTSAVNVVIHQSILQIAVRTVGWSGGPANFLAAVIVAFPAYLMSRWWVWQLDGKPSVRGEILPFWLISLLGLVVSTATSAGADAAFDDPWLISVGSLVGYVVAWVLKFFVLDRLFTASASSGAAPGRADR
jgi:putative flippase GtrA